MNKNITINNIKSFIEGNIKFYKDKILSSPEHLKEQRYYRMWKCKDTCLKIGLCQNCGCPVNKKIYTNEACSDKFPNLMAANDWNEFKKINNIDIESIKKYIENEL